MGLERGRPELPGGLPARAVGRQDDAAKADHGRRSHVGVRQPQGGRARHLPLRGHLRGDGGGYDQLPLQRPRLRPPPLPVAGGVCPARQGCAGPRVGGTDRGLRGVPEGAGGAAKDEMALVPLARLPGRLLLHPHLPDPALRPPAPRLARRRVWSGTRAGHTQPRDRRLPSAGGGGECGGGGGGQGHLC